MHSGKPQIVAGATAAADGGEGTERGEVLEVAGGGGFRGAGEGDVFAGIHAAGEPCRTRFEHAAKDFFLAIV